MVGSSCLHLCKVVPFLPGEPACQVYGPPRRAKLGGVVSSVQGAPTATAAAVKAAFLPGEPACHVQKWQAAGGILYHYGPPRRAKLATSKSVVSPTVAPPEEKFKGVISPTAAPPKEEVVMVEAAQATVASPTKEEVVMVAAAQTAEMDVAEMVKAAREA